MTTANIVGLVPNSWGHIKPLIALFAHMAERQPADALAITLLSSAPMIPKIQRELELMPAHLAERMSVIDVGVPETMFQPLPFAPVFEALWKGEPVTCKSTNKVFNLSRPTACLIDPFCSYAIPDIKSTSGGACGVYAWVSSTLATFLRYSGPEELGGFGDLAAKLDAAAAAQGKTVPEVADSVFRQVGGGVIKLPGVPEMYDYEFFPQELSFPMSPAMLIKGNYQFVQAADGLVVASSSAFEPGSVQVAREWLRGLGKDLWTVAPLEDAPAPATAQAPGAEVPQHSAEDAKILGFLDDMRAKHGERSVIFLAFGTNFYPKDTTKLHAFVEAVLDAGTPLLWSHASPSAKVPEDLAAKIAVSGLGLHTTWVPQRAVLAHAGTGWFVSHGGWNSVQEALSLRVPLVMWPFASDQPANAAVLSVHHGAAFELFAVREGAAARQPRRLEGKEHVDFSPAGVRAETRALLRRMKGEEGARVRANAARLGEALGGAWKDGGEASARLDDFLATVLARA